MLIAELANYEDKGRSAIVLKKKPRQEKEMVVFAVASLPGVGEKLAKNLLERFGSVKKIAGATKEELMEVEGIGEKKALALWKVFNMEMGGKSDD